jgi:predicted ATPase
MTDSQFNIKIKEYRAISEADIDLNGITVLSGVNGCGKSSISFFFYNFFNILLNFDKYINLDIYNKIEAPLKLIEQLLREIELGSQIKINPQLKSRYSSPRNSINLLLNNLINQRKDYNNKFYTKTKLDSIFNKFYSF